VVEIAPAPLGPSFSDIAVVEETWRLARSLGLRVMVHIAGQEKPMSALRDRGLPHSESRSSTATGWRMTSSSWSPRPGAIAPALEALMCHGGPMVCRTRGLGVLTGLATDAAQVEAAKFDPWNAVVEHRPLGEVMRARKVAYRPGQLGRGAE
jgi:5-methylthioadenosine/S-adenosylhomocysteine deaminase